MPVQNITLYFNLLQKEAILMVGQIAHSEISIMASLDPHLKLPNRHNN